MTAGSVSPPFPPVVRIEPAASCNFRCIHCPTGLDMSPTGIMSIPLFDKILTDIQVINVAQGVLRRVIVLYHGGEPLLNRDIFTMVRRSKLLAKNVKTVTNGSRLTDEIIDQIIDSGLDHIEISLDGISTQENDKIRANRVGANFASVSLNVRKLITRKRELKSATPKVFISNTQVPETIGEVNGRPKAPAHMLEAFKDVTADITYKTQWALVWPGMVKEFGAPYSNFCDHAINTITIRSNGDVVPCCYDLVSKMPIGNILNEHLMDIWGSQRYQELRRSIAIYDPPDLCKGCPVLYKSSPMLKKDIRL